MPQAYQVAYYDELAPDEPLARSVAGIDIVLVRHGDEVSAYRDRCPHRFAPLSLGKVVDGAIQCPYHGLRFGLDGRCVLNPHGDGRIPEQAVLERYPVAMRDGALLVEIPKGVSR